MDSDNLNVYVPKYYNNCVYIQSNKCIDLDDLELVILFFENSKLNGGCDTVSHSFNTVTYGLSLNYKINECKNEILKRKSFNYKSYSLVAHNKQMSMNEFQKMKNVLVLSNVMVDNVDIPDVELYGDYLVPENSIISINASKILPNTYFIKYENSFNMDIIRKRYSKRPKLRQQTVEIYEAYKTHVLIIKLDKELNYSSVTEYLDYNFNDDTKSYWQLPFKKDSSICMVTFQDKIQMNKFMNSNQRIDDKDLIIEQCFSFEVLDKYVDSCLTTESSQPQNTSSLSDNLKINNNYNIDIKKSDSSYQFTPDESNKDGTSSREDTIKLIDEILGMNSCNSFEKFFNSLNLSTNGCSGVKNLESYNNSNPETNISDNSNNNQETYSLDDKKYNDFDENINEYEQVNANKDYDDEYFYEFEYGDPFYDALYYCEKIYNDFNKFLTSCNAVCVFDTNKDYIYITRINRGCQSREKWLNTLNSCVENFWERKMECKSIPIAQELTTKLEVIENVLTEINKTSTNVFVSIKKKSDLTIGVVGYKSNIKDSIHRVDHQLNKIQSELNQLKSKSKVSKAVAEPFNEQQHIVQTQEKIPLVSTWLQSHNTSAHSLRQPSIQYNIKIENLEKKLLKYDRNETQCLRVNPIDAFSYAIINCAEIFNDLNRTLNGSAAKAIIENNKDNEKTVHLVRLSSKELSQNADPWSFKIDRTIHNFYTNKMLFSQIEIQKYFQEENLHQIKNILLLQKQHLFAHINIKTKTLTIVGYRDKVKKVLEDIKHILKSNETTIRENINDFNSASILGSMATGNKESLTERLKKVVRDKRSKDFCIHLNPLLITSLALKNCEDLLNDFKNSLAQLNAQIQIYGDLFIISSKPDPKIKNPRADKWRNDCFQVLDDYYNDKLNRKHIELSKNMQSNKAIQKIREILVDEMRRRDVFVQIDTSKYFVRICGYRNTSNELYGSIRRKILVAERETLNRNHPLHSFKITDNDEPKIEVLYHFNDNYFDLFESNLLELKAICIRSTKSFQIEIISTNLDNGSNQKEINRWREEITEFIQRFFSQFLMEKFDLPCSWEAKFPETKDVHITIDNWYVKVLGPIDSVKTFIEVHKDT